MNLFITGGTGFLGQWVIRAALEAGHKVRALVRDKHAKLPSAVDTVVGDLSKEGPLAKAIRNCDAVIHLAGKVSRNPDDGASMHEVHVRGTQVLMNAMKKKSVKRLILASTSGTIGLRDNKGGEPVDESYQPNFELVGQFPYYTSKLFQEREVMKRHEAGDVDAVLLHPSLLLGPGDTRLTSTTDVLDILQGRVPAVSDGTVAMVDVRDTANCFINALTQGRSGERYLLNGANMSVRSFAQRVSVAGDVSAPSFKLPKAWAIGGAKFVSGLFESLDRDPPLDPVAVEMSTLHWDVDASKAKQELGFSTRDPQVTIEATVRDLEERGLFRRR